MKKYIYALLFGFCILLSVGAAAQENSKKRIYGKITDKATNEEIPYAAVRIRKTSNGCSSDNNGYFSFYTAQLRDTLIISNLGYKDVKIPLSAKTKFPLNVKMVAENY